MKRVETWCGFEQLVDARVGNGVLTRLFYNIFMMMILLLVLVLLIFTVWNQSIVKAWKLNHGQPRLFQSSLLPLCFYKTPTLLPIFASRRKSEEDFRFYEERQEAKIAFSVCLVARRAGIEAAAPRPVSAAPPSSFPGNDTHSSASNCRGCEPCLWASVCYLDLFCASFRRMWPKVMASFLFTVLVYRRFHRNTLLLCSRETCIVAEQKGNIINLKII